MNCKQKIGIFDSGIGGFSVLHKVIEKIPSVEIDYISDGIFAPYGEKTDSQIINRSILITDMLLARKCTLIIVACNSATAVAISTLRLKYPDIPFVGVEPYINVMNHKNLYPGIKKAAVITTELTGNSEKFKQLKKRIDPTHQIVHISMPKLASIVEDILNCGFKTKQQADLCKELEPLKKLNISHLILGCTHYPLITQLIEDELKVITVSPGNSVANRVQFLLSCTGVEQKTGFSFMSTNTTFWEHKTTDYLFSLLKYSKSKSLKGEKS